MNTISKTINNKRFDVVVYHIQTRRVDRILGSGLRRFGTYNSAETRKESVADKLNGHYQARVVPAGRYKVGDLITRGRYR